MPGTLPDAGLADAGPGGPITVAGRVIDFFRRPTPGLRVSVGEQELITGDDGEFTVAGVVPPYDVSIIAATTQGDFAFRYYAYVYQGLTRADPTLQVYYGLPTRSSEIDLSVANAAFTEANQRLLFAFSSPNGYYAAPNINAATVSLFPEWSGGATTAGNAHALLVRRSSEDTDTPPLVYEAYRTTPLALSDETTSNLALDMSANAIPAVTLAGTVDSGQLPARHLISTRFADGTILPLLNAESPQPEFSYLVPSLPAASLVVAASVGGSSYAIVHADGVPAAADQNIELAVPRPVAPSAPADGSTAGPGTTFAWSPVGQTARVFVWHLESGGLFEGIFVITSRSEIEYPRVPGYTLTLPGEDENFTFLWFVETHGDHASVDAAAGPEGIFDSFALEYIIGSGPPRGNRGYYTTSDSRSVNIAAQ